MGTVADLLHAGIDTGMQPHGQAIAGRIDPADHRIDLFRSERHNMQDGAENLPFQRIDPVDAISGGRHEAAVIRRRRKRQLADQLARRLQPGGMGLNHLFRLRVNNRADIDGDIPRVADFKLAHGAVQHADHLIRHILLHIQNPEGRTTLPRRLEGRRDNIADRLLGQGAGINDHGVEPARLGNQRSLRIRIIGHGAGNALRRLGRAGKTDPGNLRMGHQRRAHHRAVAGQQLQHLIRNTGLPHQRHRAGGDQRRLLRRFGDDRIAADQRRRDLPGKNGKREIPRRYADKDTSPLLPGKPRVCSHLMGIITAEIRRLPYLGNPIQQGFPGFT